MLPDPPGRVRSNSYDESFLHRPSETRFQVLAPRAAEAPARLQYAPRRKFDEDGPCDPPPTKCLLPQSDGVLFMLPPSDTEQQQNSPLNRTANSAFDTKSKNRALDELPFDERSPRKEGSSPDPLKTTSPGLSPIDRFHLTAPRIAAPRPIESNHLRKRTNDSSRDDMMIQDQRFQKSVEDKGQPKTSKREDSDDDSLFEFEGAEKHESPRSRRKLRSSRVRGAEDDGEESDTSLDEPYGSIKPTTSLQQRSQEAWKRKASMRTSPKTVENTASSSLTKKDSPTSGKVSPNNESLSFSKRNTIQYIKTEHDDEMECSTQGNQSISTFYSKSAESEVEDLIKDILLIGSGKDSRPGKRKVKEARNTNQHLRQQVSVKAAHSGDESQDGTVPGTTLAKVSKRNDDGGDPLTTIWNFLFEGGANKEERDEAKDDLSTSIVACPKTTGGFLDYASELFLGRNSKASDNEQSADGATASNKGAFNNLPALASAPSLEEDRRLVELATEAARSIHRIKGCDFDDTYEIDFSKEIKFIVVDLELPLGLVFQEHDVACWVTKVLPKGSASLNGKVQVGDQLAAIDGRSAISMRVGDVASLIGEKDPAVELTFMRYVGPIRPRLGSVKEEGYEVNPGNLLKRNAYSQPNSPLRQPSPTRKRIESISIQAITSLPDEQLQGGKPLSDKPEKRRFRLFGKRKSDK